VAVFRSAEKLALRESQAVRIEAAFASVVQRDEQRTAAARALRAGDSSARKDAFFGRDINRITARSAERDSEKGSREPHHR
jgi:hypothetical protein